MTPCRSCVAAACFLLGALFSTLAREALANGAAGPTSMNIIAGYRRDTDLVSESIAGLTAAENVRWRQKKVAPAHFFCP